MDKATIEALREAIPKEFGRNAPPEGFPNLPRIPVGRYTDPEFFALERARIFDRSWLYVGTMYDFAEEGRFKVFDNMGRAEIVIVRGADDQIRAFYNTCQHRGATVIRDRSGTIQNLTCQFHSWTYNLEGKLISIPDARDFSNDPSLNDCHLKSVRCETWAGFVFVNLATSASDDAPDLQTWLGPVAEDFAWVDGLRTSNRRERVMACNWRVAIEAFIEVYHIGTVHPETVATGLNHQGTISTFYEHGHSRMIVPLPGWPDVKKREPRTPGANGRDEAYDFRAEVNVSYNIFPNLLTPAGCTGFMLMEFWPVDVNHTRIVTSVVEPDWGEGEPPDHLAQGAEYFDLILGEDAWNMEHIQHSYQSPHFEGPKIGVHEKRIYYLEQAIDAMIGPENVPEHLRVPPLLDKYIVESPQAV